MSKNPKISIILPTYNRAEYLIKAVDSCLAQTFTEFELIIIDDFSSDETLSVAKNYAKMDERVKVLSNSVNKKLPASLNIAFAEAKGKYLTWTSDDNLFHEEALETMNHYLDNMPDIGLVYTDYSLIDANGKVMKRIYQEPPVFLPIRDCVGACFLYRAEVASQLGGYNEQMFLVEDYDYWLRLGLITRLFHIPESLYFYRTHTNSLTSTRKEEIRHAKKQLKDLYLPKYVIPTEYKPILDLYMWFIEDRNYMSYFKLLKIIALHPITTMSYIIKNLRRL